MMWRWLALLLLLGLPGVALAQLPGVEAFTVVDGEGGQTYSVTFQILVIMTLLALLPAGLMMVTSFARIVIVLAILRNAIGVGNTPSNQILVGLALFLTLFVMMPVFNEVYDTALQPYLNEELAPDEALGNAVQPFRVFMLSQTREQDIALFLNLADMQVEGPEDVPLRVLVPAFMTSELKTAFQIGFILFLPFLVVDLVVASTLMSMGMLMLSPMIISMPFKIMLFVVVDGWSLIMGTLAASFFA